MNTPIAHTPPMGWNSWNTFSWNINAELICSTADVIAERFGCTRKSIEEIIDYYRKSGKCTLFR